jgi:hypothetical protein
VSKPTLPKWSMRPDILAYIIEAYAGTDESPGKGPRRRVFIWEDGSDIMMGNCEAFSIHLQSKFELLKVHPSDLHRLLRELGEKVQHHKPHAPRGEAKVEYRQPEPDEWVVGQVVVEPETE